MTEQTRATNKARFETGDAPAQSDYADLIDSFLSLPDTGVQTVTSPIIISGTLGVGGKISALSVSAPSLVASTVAASSVTVMGDVSASGGYFDTLRVAGIEVLPGGAGAGIEMYITATASTFVADADVYQAVHASAVASAVNAVEFAGSATGTVKYTGADSKRFSVHASLSLHREGGTSRNAFIRLARNGASIVSSTQERLMSTTDIGSMSTMAIISANQNDDLGLQITSDASGTVEFNYVTFVVTEV